MTERLSSLPAIRRQLLFGNRMVKAFADRPENFDRLIRETGGRHPDSPALAKGDQVLSYAAFDAALSAIAAGLARHGLRAGDHIGVLCANSIEGLLSIFAIQRLGAVAVPMGIRQQTEELDYVFNDCALAGLIFDAGLAGRLPAHDRTPALRVRIAVGGQVAGAVSFHDLEQTADFAPVAIAETAPAIIMYTSGTTGRPKGAVLPHLAMVHSAMHFIHVLGHGPHSRALLTIPASHISGLGAVVMAMLRAGGCIRIDDEFRARDFLATMQRHRITFTVLVPAMYKLCLLEPDFDDFDLSHWQIGVFGGAIMPPAVVEELARRLPALELVNAYGATETTSPATIMPPGQMKQAPDSVGRCVPCGDIRILDDNLREVAPGQPGELWINGPMIATCYWNKPEATAANFVAGYWRSGDIGAIDADGFVRILDRKKDMINRAGLKIYSAEVENALIQHEDVVETVVVPRPDPVLGERVHAFVRVKRDDVVAETLAEYCAGRLSDYKVPESWTVSTDPLPRNGNGKFEKALLAARIAAQGPLPHTPRRKPSS